MRTITRNFQKIELKVKIIKKLDGKRKQFTCSFWQTESPFNKNKDGSMKTRSQIWDEVTSEAKEFINKESLKPGFVKHEYV